MQELNEFDRNEGWFKTPSLETFLLVDPQFDNIRNDKRLQDILLRVDEKKQEIREKLRSMNLIAVPILRD